MERLNYRRSPYWLLNTLCVVTAILWLVLLGVSFQDRLLLLVAVTGLWGFAACLTCLAAVFLRKKVQSRWPLAAVPIAWTVGTLLASNVIVSYWQSRHHLWSGFEFNSRYGWYPLPNLKHATLPTLAGTYIASTDQWGHRNLIPYPADKRLPIILQGDSNAFGYGVADDQTLAARLNARLGRPLVYNLGIPGFDLNQYYYQHQEFGRRYQMGTRIILWNIWNDFTLSALETPNYFRRPYLYADGNRIRRADDFHALFPVQGYGQSFVPPFRDFDHLISEPAHDWADLYPSLLIEIPLSRQLIRTYHPKICKAARLLSRGHNPQQILEPNWMLLKQEHWPAPFDQYARDLPVLLHALHTQNRSLIVCPFPFRQQVIPAEYHTERDHLIQRGHTATDFDPLAFNKLLKEVCQILGIEFVDPTPEFLKVADRSHLYQQADQHLSAAGLDLVAKVLHEHLRSR